MFSYIRHSDDTIRVMYEGPKSNPMKVGHLIKNSSGWNFEPSAGIFYEDELFAIAVKLKELNYDENHTTIS